MTEVKEWFERLHETVVVAKEHRRLRRERKTVRAMVAIYCLHHHRTSEVCGDCSVLAAYADHRLDRCPYGAAKPSCTNCPIHCYRPDPRERMREVMRFSGPRMLLRHPWLAIMHLIDDHRRTPRLEGGRGAHRQRNQPVKGP